MSRSKIDWTAIDWSLPTVEIAKSIGWLPSNVSQKRKIYAPETAGNYKNCGKWKRTVKEISIVSPSGEVMLIGSVGEFIRKNKALFDEADLAIKTSGRGRYKKQYCAAELFLSQIRRGKIKCWKGWRLESTPENKDLGGLTEKHKKYRSVDWSKSNKTIAAELGAKYSTIAMARRQYAPDTVKRHKPRSWASVDWSRTTTDIAAELGASHTDVRIARARYAPETVRAKIDWADVDWRKDNATIAEELGRAYNTVAKRRCMLGVSGAANARKVRSDKGAKKPQCSSGGINQPIAVAAAKLSEKAGRGENNVHAKKWRLIRQDGATWEFNNLYHFIRNHPELFLPADVIWKRLGGKRGEGGEYCNASSGLLYTAAKVNRRWKGWHLKKL